MNSSKISWVLITLLYYSCSAQPQNNVLDEINKSSVMATINQGYAKVDLINLYVSCLADASPAYQELLHEAKVNLGMTDGPHVVKKMSPFLKKQFKVKIGDNLIILGFAGSLAIALDIDTLDKVSYGTRRFIMHHELTHIRYHDIASHKILQIGSFLLPFSIYSLFTYQTAWQPNHPIFTSFITMATGLYCASYAGKEYFRMCEHRADLRAAYACNCYQCVQEYSNETRCDKDKKREQELIALGYLTAQELAPIVQELKEKNCLCTYHKNKKI